jgi:hypothetical protein
LGGRISTSKKSIALHELRHEGRITMFKFGASSFIWSEKLSEGDLWVIPKVKEKVSEVGIVVVTTHTLN